MLDRLSRPTTCAALLALGALFIGQPAPAQNSHQDAATTAPTEQAARQPRAFCRYVPERAGDFAFENDRVAFRVYGPPLLNQRWGNGVDPWFKRVDYPIVDKWYTQNAAGQSYHADTGEGADIYHVGPSLGSGSTGLWHQGELHVGPCFDAYEIIEDGPERCVFELTYHWQFEGRSIKEVKRITLEMGTNLFLAESTLDRKSVV